VSSYFEHDQVARELGRQHARIEELEAAIERLTTLLYEQDDRMTSIELALGNSDPSMN
jgi:hypothetical protein